MSEKTYTAAEAQEILAALDRSDDYDPATDDALAMNPAYHAGRDAKGRLVRETWVEWARRQPSPKPSWLVPWEDLAEPDREVDRQIGEALYAAGAASTREASKERALARTVIALEAERDRLHGRLHAADRALHLATTERDTLRAAVAERDERVAEVVRRMEAIDAARGRLASNLVYLSTFPSMPSVRHSREYRAGAAYAIQTTQAFVKAGLTDEDRAAADAYRKEHDHE